MNKSEVVCTCCVMDTTDPEIVFDQEGVCNYCRYLENVLPLYHFSKEQEVTNLERIIKEIKEGSNTKYDSVIGLSGGVDSSYVAYLAHKSGLNPLCVHFDNGWNSEIAVSNIKKIVDKCGFDLETYVINWPEFKDLQRAFFKAGVLDIEMLTDHAIMATMFNLRKKHNIKYVLSGVNIRTENGMPNAWLWRKQDLVNIKDIHKKFGSVPLKEFPTLSSLGFKIKKMLGWGGKYVEILNNINYSKKEAMKTLASEFGWEYYGGKHYESVFTRFYQAYILPFKFNVDKRKVHLSSLIRSGEITRDEALIELGKPLYDPQELKRDRQYVTKKLGFTEDEFEKMMNEKPKSHLDYKSDEWIIQLWLKLMGKKKMS
ncbi:N-acetyl sugar amidotransferase [Pedobacter cryoconitis]|uniref:N-acetyl sugar amidotransferase n=1 Tax=Pedobacter cryoconitis TaxID=188932 RepID=A0A7W9DYU1_9SPHI|nr:N-acetyl sugar amidotransferase [Pedobacter cryoconitis]MBB5636592.1 N-acetyl sugar amidotransferase [Pedobacter cryoconitis]